MAFFVDFAEHLYFVGDVEDTHDLAVFPGEFLTAAGVWEDIVGGFFIVEFAADDRFDGVTVSSFDVGVTGVLDDGRSFDWTIQEEAW